MEAWKGKDTLRIFIRAITHLLYDGGEVCFLEMVFQCAKASKTCTAYNTCWDRQVQVVIIVTTAFPVAFNCQVEVVGIFLLVDSINVSLER